MALNSKSLILLSALVGLAAQPSQAQTEAPAEPPAAVEALVAPVPRMPLHIALPPDAPELSEATTVSVLIRIDTNGEVDRVSLVKGEPSHLVDAVLLGATHFTFEPARYQGEPVPVEIAFEQPFLPTAPRDDAAGPERTAILTGQVFERGTRSRVAQATVAVIRPEREYVSETDAEGRFRLEVPAGWAEIRIAKSGYNAFLQREELFSDEALQVVYRIDRTTYQYETVVVAQRQRQTISRTRLEGRELQRMPGALGDPFRVINALPGTTQPMSLLPMPIVRGSSPSNTGVLLDGVRMPLLFHWLVGRSVIHPEFVDAIEFFPGSFPVEHGGYTGGIINGVTRAGRMDERRIDMDVTLTEAGLFVRQPIAPINSTVSAAGRYGYPGLLLSLIDSDVRLSYWDYQLRFDHGTEKSKYTLFALGAFDQLSSKPSAEELAADPKLSSKPRPTARLQFHRLDLRHTLQLTRYSHDHQLVLGFEQTQFGTEGGQTSAWNGTLRLNFRLQLVRNVALRFGAQGIGQQSALAQPSATAAAAEPDSFSQAVFSDARDRLLIGSAYVELPWQITDNWHLIPGARTDVYDHKQIAKASVDPRVFLRYRPYQAVDETQLLSEVWLKAGAGLYHQPPRFFLPLPGAAISGLENGLLRAVQVSLGGEASLTNGFELDVQSYYNHMDPILFELQLDTPFGQSDSTDGMISEDSTADDIRQLFFRRMRGRSYGLEVLLRKRDTSALFGWIAYTLSRSERFIDGRFRPFDFDRSHILNLVAGLHLPRNWDFGARVQMQTGTPLDTVAGDNTGRSPVFCRVDIRFDKRAVWNSWLFDFYIDVLNITYARETGGIAGQEGFRYVLPVIGIRAIL